MADLDSGGSEWSEAIPPGVADSVQFDLSTAGKNNFIVNANNTTTPVGKQEPIRSDYGALWNDPSIGSFNIPPSLEWGRNSISTVNNAKIQAIVFEPPNDHAPGSKAWSQFGYKDQVIRVYPNTSKFESYLDWIAHVEFAYATRAALGGTGTDYFDYATEYASPFTPRESYNLPDLNGISVASTHFSYNFYIEKYENIVDRLNIEERIYPNLYTFYIEKDRGAPGFLGGDIQGTDVALDVDVTATGWGSSITAPQVFSPSYNDKYTFNDFVTLNRAIDSVFINSLRPRRGETGIIEAREKVGETDRAEYFDVWASQYPSVDIDYVYDPFDPGGTSVAQNRARGLDIIMRKYSAIMIPASTLEIAQVEYNAYKHLFPMYCEIEYKPSFPSDVGNTLINTKLMNNLMKHVYQDSQNSDTDREYTSTGHFQESHEIVTDTGAVTRTVAAYQRRLFDLNEWVYGAFQTDAGTLLEDLANNTAFTAADRPGSHVFLRNFRNGTLANGLPQTRPGNALEALTELNAKLLSLTANYSRSYQEILAGARAYSEDLFFKIVKYRVVNGAREENPIQTFYVPNKAIGTQGLINLIDTQLKYDQQYDYEMFTCRFVIGSTVLYSSVYVPPPEAEDGFTSEYGSFDTSGGAEDKTTSATAGPAAGGGPASPYGGDGCPHWSDDALGYFECQNRKNTCTGTWVGSPTRAGTCEVLASDVESGGGPPPPPNPAVALGGCAPGDYACEMRYNGCQNSIASNPEGWAWSIEDLQCEEIIGFDTADDFDDDDEELDFGLSDEALEYMECPEGFYYLLEEERCVERAVLTDSEAEGTDADDVDEAMGYDSASNCPEDDEDCLDRFADCDTLAVIMGPEGTPIPDPHADRWDRETLTCYGDPTMVLMTPELCADYCPGESIWVSDVDSPTSCDQGSCTDPTPPAPAEEAPPPSTPGPPPDYRVSVTVRVSPSIKVIELPYVAGPTTDASFSRGTVLDDPPMPPEVDFIPYRGVNNQILLNLQGGIGERMWDPIVFNDQEQVYVDRLREMVADPRETRILYENDDPSVVFEIYRLDKKPRSYLEVKRAVAKPVRVMTQSPLTDNRRVSSTSYLDSIEPNRKYYYILRALDIHGHASYPTEIYEVEMVDNDGAVYPIIRAFPLPEEQYSNPLKKMRRFLQVKLQTAQSIYNRAAADVPEISSEGDEIPVVSVPLEGSLPLGVREKSVWGRKFKIRLTSKKTGRKVDLNLNFKKNYDSTRTIPLEVAAAVEET